MGILIFTVGWFVLAHFIPLIKEDGRTVLLWAGYIIVGLILTGIFEVDWAMDHNEFSIWSFLKWIGDCSPWVQSFDAWKRANQEKKSKNFIELSFNNFKSFYELTQVEDGDHPYITLYPYVGNDFTWMPRFYKSKNTHPTIITFKSIKDYHSYYQWIKKHETTLRSTFDKDAYITMINILQTIQKNHEKVAEQ